MGKIRVKTLGDEAQEKEQAQQDKARRAEKKFKKKQQGEAAFADAEETAAGIDTTSESPASESKPKKERKIKIRVHSKRYQQLRGIVDRTKLYKLPEAIELLQKTSNTKFIGTAEAHISVNPEALGKDKKTLSGSVNLPHGTGKKRVIAIVDDALIELITKGTINFDVLVSHPSFMPKLGRLAKVLGPRGLMPNPKNSTVTTTPEKRVKELEGGEINWKSEPDQPIIHQAIGKVNFTASQLTENLKALVMAIGANKIMKLTLSSSMGPGIKVDLSTV